jgi:hypothetical protein
MFSPIVIFDKEFTFLNTYDHSFQWEITKVEHSDSSIIMEVSEKEINTTNALIKCSIIRFDTISKFQKNEISTIHQTRISKVFMSDVVHVVAKGQNFSIEFLCKSVTLSNITTKEIDVPRSLLGFEKETTKDPYAEFLERFLALGWEKNEKMKAQFGAFSYRVNMEEHRVTISDLPPFPAQILGSFSLTDNTWCWSHSANERSNIPIAMQEDALKLKAMGEKYGIEVFTKGLFDTTENDILAMSAASAAYLERSAYFVAVNDDFLIVFTIDQLPNWEMEDTRERLIASIQRSAQHEMVNARKVFRNFLESKGFEVKDESSVICLAARGEIQLIAHFNQNGGLENIV